MAHTEMTNPGGFVYSNYYRNQMLGPHDDNNNNNNNNFVDSPLVLQLGGSNIPKLTEAARYAIQTQ
jgi:tRNA-dihydrouridine synthase